ncbi:hypothetical protein ATCC90586_011724 [Pythium insidiosum]|nr:hypothetical protein ATCC90586_011320 [Pythium insidiosum]KAJ0390152.1 hypothetical protein ATCC90586_011724 [Pythium insidiosum]
MLLVVTDWHESDTFWLLTSLLSSPLYQLEQLFAPGLPHLNLRVFQLERLLEIYLPELSAHLSREDFPLSMVVTGWFMTLFSNLDVLGADVVVRVLDGFIVDGWKHLLRVSLVILETLQPAILASSFEEIPEIFYDISLHALL